MCSHSHASPRDPAAVVTRSLGQFGGSASTLCIQRSVADHAIMALKLAAVMLIVVVVLGTLTVRVESRTLPGGLQHEKVIYECCDR